MQGQETFVATMHGRIAVVTVVSKHATAKHWAILTTAHDSIRLGHEVGQTASLRLALPHQGAVGDLTIAVFHEFADQQKASRWKVDVIKETKTDKWLEHFRMSMEDTGVHSPGDPEYNDYVLEVRAIS